jgi:hypothetical protein
VKNVRRNLGCLCNDLVERHDKRRSSDCRGAAAESPDAILNNRSVAVNDHHIFHVDA